MFQRANPCFINPFRTNDIAQSQGGLLYVLRGTQVKISPKNIEFLSLKIVLVLANSIDPDEMPHHAAFHLGRHFISVFAVCQSIRFGVSGLFLKKRYQYVTL